MTEIRPHVCVADSNGIYRVNDPFIEATVDTTGGMWHPKVDLILHTRDCPKIRGLEPNGLVSDE